MIEDRSGTRRYLAVFLPLLPAERAIRASVASPDAAFALVEKIRGAIRVAAVDARAVALGIVPGLTLADARARVPDLIAVDHDPLADVALIEWLADGCERYSPTVATDPPWGIILDITGCEHPFGHEQNLADDLRQRLSRHGLTARCAVAASPDAATGLAAAVGQSDVHELPVSVLRVDPEVHLALRRAGLKSIGDLARRPRGPLEARFGSAVTTLLARLLGEVDIRLNPRRHPPAVMVERRFAEPIVQHDAALAALDTLAREAAVVLGEQGAGGRRFEATLFRSDGHVARLAIETGQPTRDPKILGRLFRERIETLSDPLDPGFGYDLIRLGVTVTEALMPLQLQLDGGEVAAAEIAALLDRLNTRLGRGRVRRFRAGDSYVPEQAAFELPIGEGASSAWPAPEPGEPPLRPLHLFDPPQPIEVMAEVPDGPPFRFRWRRVFHEVHLAEGPERIAAEWWRRRSGKGPTRDYYRVEDRLGRRFWVFRNGLYGVERAMPDWYLHGLFA